MSNISVERFNCAKKNNYCKSFLMISLNMLIIRISGANCGFQESFIIVDIFMRCSALLQLYLIEQFKAKVK